MHVKNEIQLKLIFTKIFIIQTTDMLIAEKKGCSFPKFGVWNSQSQMIRNRLCLSKYL